MKSTSAPQEISIIHNLSTQRSRSYGRIVVTGDGDGDTTGDIIGDGVMTGCAFATESGGGDGDIEPIGDIVAMGDTEASGETTAIDWAEAAAVAPPAIPVPTKTMPTNHLFIELYPPLDMNEPIGLVPAESVGLNSARRRHAA